MTMLCETAMENIMSLWIYTVCCRGDSHFRTEALLRWGYFGGSVMNLQV